MGTAKNIPSLMKIGERIRAVRQSRGMTQSELAGDEVTRNMLSRIENGAALPSLPTLCAIAARLDVPVGALIDNLEGYAAHKAEADMRALIEKERYAEAIKYYDGTEHVKNTQGILPLFANAAVLRAWELYREGSLTEALSLLSRAKESGGGESERIYVLRELISACHAITCEATEGDKTEQLRSLVFDKNDTEIYLYALTRLGDISARPYSQPSEKAAPLLSELTPIISGLSDGVYKTHIEAKFDMLLAEYLSAKAKLLTLLTHDIPPPLLWAVYTDLEFCCKCCGDFENAYKYSGLRLELIKKIN